MAGGSVLNRKEGKHGGETGGVPAGSECAVRMREPDNLFPAARSNLRRLYLEAGASAVEWGEPQRIG
jgi:hypothetical protein